MKYTPEFVCPRCCFRIGTYDDAEAAPLRQELDIYNDHLLYIEVESVSREQRLLVRSCFVLLEKNNNKI